MHHHLFPSEDTYLTNLQGYTDRNFGITEIVRIGTDAKNVRTRLNSKTFQYVGVLWNGYCVEDFMGSLTGSASGSVSYTGSIGGGGTISGTTGSLSDFIGFITSSGTVTGIVTGTDTRQIPRWVTTSTKFIDRTLIKFDLSTISSSIANLEIADPKFTLNLKVCNEYQLPIQYSIYAFPVSQSWVMGNGYFSDGGSHSTK